VFHRFPISLFLQKSFESRLIEMFVDARLRSASAHWIRMNEKRGMINRRNDRRSRSIPWINPNKFYNTFVYNICADMRNRQILRRNALRMRPRKCVKYVQFTFSWLTPKSWAFWSQSERLDRTSEKRRNNKKDLRPSVKGWIHKVRAMTTMANTNTTYERQMYPDP